MTSDIFVVSNALGKTIKTVQVCFLLLRNFLPYQKSEKSPSNRKYAGVVLVDLSKVFDTTTHQILIVILNYIY